MNQARLAWAAFRNMLRAAARDPLWAIIALVSAPFLLWRPVLGAAGIILLVLLVVGVGGEFALGQLGFQQGDLPFALFYILVLLLVLWLVFRFITNPMILHFGDMEGDTHGSARFATDKKPPPSARTTSRYMLHQAAERLYHCVLLTLALYSPKSHKLTFLRSQAERIAPQLVPVWPRETRFAKRSFTRLERVYVDARYSPAYEITGEELAWLVERVKALQETIAAIYTDQLDGPDATEA